MNKKNNFLVEIGTEELPPVELLELVNAFKEQIKVGLQKAELEFKGLHDFATPRRLAVIVKELAGKQKNTVIERRGPSLQNAFDDSGKPTMAAQGFAKSCGVKPEELDVFKDEQGGWLVYKHEQVGEKTEKLLPGIVTKALKNLPVKRPMHWGDKEIEFIRPVHWVLMLYGNRVIKSEILGVTARGVTYGHRFHYNQKIKLNNASEYADVLRNQGGVIADFEQRKNIVKKEIESISKNYGFPAIDENLLLEVAGLVEWPVALRGEFPKHFLKLPKEVLILSMQKHQKCFPVMDNNKKLLPLFITISNIKSKNPDKVIVGNERVINARLNDAEFFYNTDLKQPLENYLERLKDISFQHGLGTVYDKAKRIEKLAGEVARLISADKKIAKRAGLLAKADLATGMVGEFPELQGVVGFYYSKQQGMNKQVSVALEEHYLPRFAGDILPKTDIGCAVAIADRADTIAGMFGISKIPTGEKDPFGLRRAALGVLRIIVEKKLEIDLRAIFKIAEKNYAHKWQSKVQQILDFMFDRLRSWYLEQGVSPQIFASVHALYPIRPHDFAKRIKALQQFLKLPQAEALAIANKRVSNILKKAKAFGWGKKLKNNLLKDKIEIELANLLNQKEKKMADLCGKGDYSKALASLAELKEPVDKFFDNVMVMVEEKKLQTNRLALLDKLRSLFLLVADVSLL